MSKLGDSDPSSSSLRRVRGLIADMVPGQKVKVWDHYLGRTPDGWLVVRADPGEVYKRHSMFGHAVVERTETGWDVTLLHDCPRLSRPAWGTWLPVEREYRFRFPNGLTGLGGRKLIRSSRALTE